MDDLRQVLYTLGKGLTHRTVKELCTMVADTSRHRDKVYYRDLTDTEIKDAE